MVKLPPSLEGVFKDVRSKHYPKGQIMLYQGDPPLEVLLLTKGIIKVYDVDENGKEKVLTLLRPWAIAPFVFFSDTLEATHWYYAALTDCEVCVAESKLLIECLQNNADLALSMMNWFSMQMHQILLRMSSLGKTNTRDKLLAALKYLATNHASKRKNNWCRVNFQVSHQLLADMTGVTRESAATIMKTLKEEDIIRQPKQTILEINIERID